MKKELVCIVCPRGCHLTIDENNNVTGNSCPRGVTYAINEITNPLRMLTSTVFIKSELIKRLPVITSKEISKNLQGVFRNDTERKLAVDKELGKRLEKDYKNTDKFISQNEFTEVQNLSSAIAESSAIQKGLKSQIGKIENNQLNDSSK